MTFQNFRHISVLVFGCLLLWDTPAQAENAQPSSDALVDALIRLQVRKGIITEADAKQLRAEAEALAREPKVSARRAAPSKSSPQVDIGLQYRVMYNAANLPGRESSTFADPDDYDFFRQRFRLSVDVKPVENAGGFAQFEFRNTWGGGPFNRLDARGVRYGYVYYLPAEAHKLTAGILPISDRVGDTLFSADWDFNVGGIEYLGEEGELAYRLSYLRLVDTLDSGLDRDGHFLIGDLSHPVGSAMLGAHAYFLQKDGNSGLTGFLAQEAEEGWYALSLSGDIGESTAKGFVILNQGSLDEDSHTGVAIKGEVSIPAGDASLSALALFTTGDSAGSSRSSSFVTPQGLLGTGGYWQYTHIFAANGPSDVNDLGVNIGNADAGLLTLQSKLDYPFSDLVAGQLDVGWFRATEARNSSRTMGVEVGGMLNIKLTDYLNFEVGGAGAFLGDFFAAGTDDVFEIFSRFQLEF